MKNKDKCGKVGLMPSISNLRPDEVLDAERVQNSPHMMYLLSNIRQLNTGIVGIQKPTRLAEMLYRTARYYTELNNNLYHVLDRTVVDGKVQLLVHPYHEDADHVIAIRMEAVEWSDLLKRVNLVQPVVMAV